MSVAKRCTIIAPIMAQKHVTPKLITEPEELAGLVDTLQAQPVVAVDTESNSLFAYREQVCLIQFSIPKKDFLVDPLTLSNLSVLKTIFADPKIEKVFHAAEYDLLTLQRDFGFKFNNLFDTMVAARILGRKHVGLGSLLEEEFGVELEKKYQRANWGKRPLPHAMLIYASLDTHYLIKLRNLLADELDQRGRWLIAREDFDRLTQVNGKPPEPHGVDVWRVSGVYDLNSQQVTILKHLAEYREERARSLDSPLFKVIGDKTLIAVAEKAPKTLEELAGLPGMTPGQVRRHGKAILQAVYDGQQEPPTKRPRTQYLDDQVVNLIEALRNWRKLKARKIGVESDIVLPRDILEKIGHAQPDSKESLAELMKDLPWRFKEYGDQIFHITQNF
jgi:ribonuclease D